MKLRSAARTDIGRVRDENQDRFLCDDALALYGVADGIGGLPGGSDAAACAIEILRRCVEKAGIAAVPNLVEGAASANNEVLYLSRAVSPLYGMGTTLCCGVIRDDCLHLVHLGDSRCYVLRKGSLAGITTDHNVENEAKQRLAKGEYVRITDRNRGALTRCIGQVSNPTADLIKKPLESGDRVFFCSDGIYRMLKEKELAKALDAATDPGACLEQLIATVNERGGYDNSTAVLVFVE